MSDLKTYSVLIKWADNDDDQGNYGTVVRAASYEEAEEKARADMRENHIANHCDADDDEEAIAESCADYEHVDNWTGKTIFGGECQECAEGAIWKAAELETRLRDLLRQVDEMATRSGWADHGEREAARKLLAEIDGTDAEAA